MLVAVPGTATLIPAVALFLNPFKLPLNVFLRSKMSQKEK